MAQRYNFVVHLRRERVDAPILEVSGTFVGNYVQAYAHIQGIARQYEAEIVAHTIREADDEVRRSVARPVKPPLALPPPPSPPPKVEATLNVEPTLPEGCEWATVEHYDTQEYTYNGNCEVESKSPAHRLH